MSSIKEFIGILLLMTMQGCSSLLTSNAYSISTSEKMDNERPQLPSVEFYNNKSKYTVKDYSPFLKVYNKIAQM